jgi:hypothetical protein
MGLGARRWDVSLRLIARLLDVPTLARSSTHFGKQSDVRSWIDLGTSELPDRH